MPTEPKPTILNAGDDASGRRADEERKRLLDQHEHQLRQAQKMEALARLAGGVAHDFNNLLTIIGGYGQMAFDSLKPEDPVRGDLEAVLEASNRAGALTRRLLTFSRRQIVKPKVLDLNREIARISRMLRRAIGEDIDLVTSLKADPARIAIDPAQLEQVLLNIAGNARDAMPKGGKLTIRTASLKAGDAASAAEGITPGPRVMLAISDTGSGMSEDTLNHLFEPFYTTKGKGKGTGLGLSEVYGIVKQAGGEITVDSEVGRGTTVRISLPPAIDQGKDEEARSERQSAGAETILLVEDEAGVRRLASEMLARQGYGVIEAASGAEALRIWQERAAAINMVLTDVIMPEMSGSELARELNRLCPALRIAYMSGYTDDILAQHGILETKTPFLHKPFTLDSLARTVRSVLDRKDNQ
jgi:two-component system cell cycle sensor histidine kinase/response regulator CckA